jgi:predicted acylesterase/phospholipase RssA
LRSVTAYAVLMALAVLAGGCAGAIDRNPVPTALASETASIPDIPGARFWADETPKDLKKTYREYLRGVPLLGASAPKINGRLQIEVLALSGGGSDGAFGAGVLNGWTARGDRPEFEHVTGVSAGSIIAPFAFLGPKYDPQIKEIWTQFRTDELIVPQVVTGLLGGSALADTGPLKKLVAKYVDREFLKKIARQYERGRLLTVGTTNLDAKRPVVWNMGAIAQHYDDPAAVQLFRDVIIASAAIPGLFPPVQIKVKVDGKLYDELHVDGGVTRQIYVTPVNVPIKAFDVLYESPPQRKLYLVHNGKMQPTFGAVTPTTFSIAGDSIGALMLYQHRGDNYRIYRMAKDAGVDFNSVAIPPTFDVVPKEKFDLNYQKAVFEEGFRIGKAKEWMKKPIDVPDEIQPRIAKPEAPPTVTDPAAAQPPAALPAQPAPSPSTSEGPPSPGAPGPTAATDRVSAL